MHRFIGLDVHKAYVYGYELQEKGTGRTFRFPNTPEGWTKFCATLDGSAHVALEVTGNAYRCYDLVSPHAGKVLLVNPSARRRLGVKTDRLDAKTMAEQLALGLIPEVWVPPAPIRELRVLIKHRYNLVRRRTMFKNALKAALLRNGLTLDRFAAITERALEKWLRADLSEADRLVLVSSAAMVMALDVQVAEVERQILKRVRGVGAVRQLASIPGLGLISAAAIYAFVGDPQRFGNGKAVARYAGLDPAVYQSGQTHRIGRISKQGPPLLRWHLVEAAWSIGRFDRGPLGQFYRRMQASQSPAKAAVATARKLLVVAWAMWRRGEVYRADQPSPSYARKLRELDRQAEQAAPLEELIQRLRVELDTPPAQGATGRRGGSLGAAA
ncbi:MAG: IS110 family transposase [Limnochordaceae bacterium]|nr:IS110 family transposase [Limnochordaceae bacterium]